MSVSRTSWLLIWGAIQALCCAQQAEVVANFSSVDLVTMATLASGAKVPVHAFLVAKSGNNTFQQLVDANGGNKACQAWLSHGYPEAVRQTSKLQKETKQATVVHFSESGFTLDLQFLTTMQQSALAKAASVKYNVSVAAEQIGFLLPSRLECFIELTSGVRPLRLVGKATDLTVYPYSVFFNFTLLLDANSDALRTLRALNEASGLFDELRYVTCEVDFATAWLKDRVWSLPSSFRRTFRLILRRADYFVYEGSEEPVNKAKLESDCPAFRQTPWRTSISFDTVPQAISIADCVAKHFVQTDQITIALYEHRFRSLQWEEARLLCESIGWKLARLTTQNLWKSALQLVNKDDLSRSQRIWVGARRELRSSWKWYNTNLDIDSNIWCANKPASDETVSCVYIPSRSINDYGYSRSTCMHSDASGSVYAKYFMCTQN